MSLLQQAQQEGLCLHFPESLGQHREVSLEMAVNTLLRAVPMSNNVAFHWRYIDKPLEGQLAMLFLPPQTPFPNDGVRYQENETTHVMNAGPGRELEVSEIKSGFIPGSQDQNAWRVRRRFRLLKGGHPHFVLVHYSRGPSVPILPSLMSQPVRIYPLRTVAEPPTIVLGEKAGQKVYPPGAPGMQPPPPPASAAVNAPGVPIMPGGPPGMGNMAFNHPASQAAMISQQNNAMEQLERRREREREKERAVARDRSGSTSGRPPLDDGSDDENDQISTRTLALARYKRNHELMNEVFRQAAFGDKSRSSQPSPYSIFNKDELEGKNARLEAEIEKLKQKAAERQARRAKDQTLPDVSMVLSA